jgi:hypothetical protein
MSAKRTKRAKRSEPRRSTLPARDPSEGSRETAAHEPQRDDAKARERKVDNAVEMTFPASDPTAPGHATGTEPASRPVNRQAPIISKEDIERAAADRG